MGDVFRGGNQNVIATIDSKKVSTQEFVNYLNQLNLNEKEIKDLKNNDLIEKVLGEYIGRKVMALEIEQSGITVNDNSLRNIIKNDKLFSKNNKLSSICLYPKPSVLVKEFEKALSVISLSSPIISYISDPL